MDNFPSALVIASFDSVCRDNNMLYRLVRPLPDGIGVQSTDKLVNVVPFRRKYTFEKKHQLDDFGQQMLKRPLVMQPVLHFGRGFGNNCALSYDDELWLVMVNQTHPKILSRLQMGLDSAKGAIERGQPFEIKFRFGKLIQRVYREHLAQKERGEAQKSSSVLNGCMTYFRYVEWEHCDLHLRYLGYGAHLNRSSALHSLPNLEMKWDFEDIGMHEMEWRQFNGEVHPRPHLSAVYEDEIREFLPGWTINSVSPLENIGDSIPENNYNYAQAGRLYASFRKKKPPRNIPQLNAVPGSSHINDYVDEPYEQNEAIEGAVGYDPSVHPGFADSDEDINEHDFGYHEADSHVSQSQSRQRYGDTVSDYHGLKIHNQDIHRGLQQVLPYNDGVEHSGSGARSQLTRNTHHGKSQLPNQPKHVVTAPQPDKYGHIHANVQIISNSPSQNYQEQTPSNEVVSSSTSGYHLYADPFKKQDSDRFSRSTNADSGYCPDGDEVHSRGGSYDYNEPSYTNTQRLKLDYQGYNNLPRGSDAYNDDGIENPAFSYDHRNTSKGLHRQEQFGSKLTKDPHDGHVLKGSSSSKSDHNLNINNQNLHGNDNLYTNSSDVMKVPPRRKKAPIGSSGVPQIAESFI